MPDETWEQLSERVWLVPGAVNAAVLHGPERAVVIDTGADKDAGMRILRGLRARGGTLAAIVTSHAHADHFGGNAAILRQQRVPVYAPPVEAELMRAPVLEPQYLFHGAVPPPELTGRWLQAEPSPVDHPICARAYERLLRHTPDHAAVHAWVDVVKQGPQRERGLTGLVNAVLRRVDLGDARGDDALSLPGWLARELRALLGDADAAAAARGMLEPEPLWLTALGDGAIGALEADGARVTPGPVAGSIAVRAPRPLPALRAFRDGRVQPQNPASLAVVHACRAGAGDRVLDLCGGNAIKAAGLAARGALVTSVELDARVSEAGRRNLERLGLRADHLVADLTSVPDLDAAPVVLLDAPCTGTGTLRGHPEIKARVSEVAVASLARLQASLLDTAAVLTSPGGRLVYAVCALTRAEGPLQIEAFLRRHPAFERAEPDLPLATVAAGPGRVILPVDGLDGFFVAALLRLR